MLDAFCRAFNAGDIEAVTALLLETSSVEVVGVTTQYGREAAKRTVVFGMLFGVKRMVEAETRGGIETRFVQGVLGAPPRVEARLVRGEWLLLHWYEHEDGAAVRAVTRLDLEADGVARLRNYFFNPELVAEVCRELDVPFRLNGHRWFLPGEGR